MSDDRIVEFPALKDAQGKLDAKRKGLADIFREAGPDYDMSKVKSLSGDTHAKVAEIGKLNSEIDDCKKKVDELLVVARAAAASSRSEEGVEKGADEGQVEVKGSRGEVKSFGQMFAESKAFKEYGNGYSPTVVLPTSLKTLFQTTDGWTPESTRTGIFTAFPTRPAPHVVDAVPTLTTSMQLVKYMEETTFTNNAAEIAEGGTYAEAVLKVTERSSPVQKIAVFLPMTDEQMADEEGAVPYVNQRLPFMLRQRLDSQVLNGDGSGNNLLGTANVVGIQTQAAGTDSAVDAIYKGARKIRDNGFAEPSVVFIQPAQWETIRLLKTADGAYIWGHPSVPGVETLWGIPVVQATAVAANTAVLGDYATHSALFNRSGIDVQTSNSHSDYFIKGQVAVRASVRVALVHLRPKAFCNVTGI